MTPVQAIQSAAKRGLNDRTQGMLVPMMEPEEAIVTAAQAAGQLDLGLASAILGAWRLSFLDGVPVPTPDQAKSLLDGCRGAPLIQLVDDDGAPAPIASPPPSAFS